MKKETMDLIIESAYRCNIEASEYENYSGRGMYGKTTCGVTVKRLLHWGAICAQAAIDLQRDWEYYEQAVSENQSDVGLEKPSLTLKEFMSDIRSCGYDCLGLGYIIY